MLYEVITTAGGAAAADPNSGLHNFSTATRHDNNLAGGNCVNCHSSTPSSGHQNRNNFV